MTESLTNNTNLAVKEILGRLANTVFNAHSILVLVLSVTVALLLGRGIATVLRRLVAILGTRSDKTQNLRVVNRLRRYETMIVLSIAIIRTGLILFAFYFWWTFVHPAGQPTAIIGASALLLIVISGALSPALRDIAAGGLMMVEQWYGVGDHIRVEPFTDLQGVVERVTLRSTRIRGLNGEVIWINNQSIQGVRITPKGFRTIALELFVTNLPAGQKLIAATNKLLPIGPLLVVKPLEIISTEEVGDKLWQITAIGETGPGREWLIETSATELIKRLDSASKSPIIAHGPLPRFADIDAERRFTRTISNTRKRPAPKRRTRSKADNEPVRIDIE
jgi:moderate conductance mechanosensitive channel